MMGCWKNKLFRECRKLDALLYPSVDMPIDSRLTSELAKMNTYTMYKICKLLDKNLDVNAYDHYCTLSRRKAFRFMSA